MNGIKQKIQLKNYINYVRFTQVYVTKVEKNCKSGPMQAALPLPFDK
jgi:hypothetical protein